MCLLPNPSSLDYLYSDLTEGENENLKRIANLMDKNIFTSIIKSENKEQIIIEKVEQFNYYLYTAFTSTDKLIELCQSPELLDRIYAYFRKEVSEKVSSRATRVRLYETIDLVEEHDRIITKVYPNIDELISLIESVGSEDYSHILGIFRLTFTAIIWAMETKPEEIDNLSLIAKKYADKLEPFVANFQISLEPELSSLKKKTSEDDVEKAKELRGLIREY
jgi:hypothetical protein